MKICVDENIPLITVLELKESGHDVLDIRGTDDQGISDDFLWEKVQKEKRLVITTDKGFVNHRRESHFGILVVRLHQPNELKIHERVMGAVRQFADEDWNGLLAVMRDVVQSSWREAVQA